MNLEMILYILAGSLVVTSIICFLVSWFMFKQMDIK